MSLSYKFCDNCGASNQIGAVFCFSCAQQFSRSSIALSQNKPTLPSLNDYFNTNTLFVQRYRVLKLLGQGGMGSVYQVEDLRFDGAVRAIKELSQNSMNPQELREAADAFQHEAVMLAKLSHPNLPRIYDHFNEAGRWYLVMDYIEGETLEDRLARLPNHKCTIEESIKIGIHLCSVFTYLHTHQPPIIFRDLKPANIMLTSDDHVYLIDFGIARLFKPHQAKDTIALGSPGYAAPEQYGRTQTTSSADIYSLGAVLHQMLSGDDPSADPFQFSPLQLTHLPKGIELANLVMQMVETKREKRPANVLEVKKILQTLEYKNRQTITPLIRKQPVTSPTLSSSGMSTSAKAKVAPAQRYVHSPSSQKSQSKLPSNPIPTPLISNPGSRLPGAQSVHVTQKKTFTQTKRRQIIGCATLIIVLLFVGVGSAVFQSYVGMGNTPTDTSKSPLANPVPPSNGRLLYQANWLNNVDHWPISGQWKYDPEKKMLMSDGSQDNYVILAPYTLPTANYAVEAEIQYESQKSFDGNFGIAFRIGKNGQGYVCDVVYGGHATVSSIGDDGRAHEITDETDYRPGAAFHRYRIEVRGNNIYSFIDGQEFAQTTDDSYPQEGSAGLRANGIIIHIRSFKVFAL
ncbi:MAG: protein kinase domain-containing protein [Ktedonobacteraceae bacterium]